MAGQYGTDRRHLNDCLGHQREITPNDSAALDHTIRAIMAGTAGTVMVLLEGDLDNEDLKFPIELEANVRMDSYLIGKVYATGTTATGLRGFY